MHSNQLTNRDRRDVVMENAYHNKCMWLNTYLPAVMLQADHSEKRSIIKLIGTILNIYAKKHDSLCLRLQVMAIVCMRVCVCSLCTVYVMLYGSVVNILFCYSNILVTCHFIFTQVTDNIVKSAATLYQQLSDDEIQEGVRLMEEGTEKRLQ